VQGTQSSNLQLEVYLLPVHAAPSPTLLSSPAFPGQASVSPFAAGFLIFFSIKKKKKACGWMG
jgi:hypothetical protein